MKKNQLILFGAGKNGLFALEKYGPEHIAFFCDNSKEKQGTKIAGIIVISFEEMVSFYRKGYTIMVTPVNYAYMVGQLEMEGIFDYLIFRDERLRFPLYNLKNEEKYDYNNKMLDDFVAKSRSADLLKDISSFVQLAEEALKMYKEEKIILYYLGMRNSESDLYGNLQAIMQYAEIPDKDKKYFPIISHAGCMLLYTPTFLYKSAVIMQGEYYKRKIHERAPYVPVFSIGPYIHYVQGIYNSEQLKKEKERIGKMLLIFLPHSIESAKREYNRYVFIDNILNEYESKFQSIWCCIYWADINKSICEYAESNGIHVVTAGFRFDVEFNRRLKTILELSDAVVVGDVGTFVAYALYMGKPIGRVNISNKETIQIKEAKSDIERKLQMKDEESYEKAFYKIFTKNYW